VIGVFVVLALEITFIAGAYQITIPTIKLSSSLTIFDPYLMLLRGIIGVLSRRDKFRDDDYSGLSKDLLKARKKYGKSYLFL